jgi:hypothetical protein
MLYNTFDKFIIPYFGKILGAYYGLTRGSSGEQYKQPVYQLSLPMPDNGRRVKGQVKAKT